MEGRDKHDDVRQDDAESTTLEAGETAAADAAEGELEGAEYPQQWQSTTQEEWSGIPAAQREVDPGSMKEAPKGFRSEAETDEDEEEREGR